MRGILPCAVFAVILAAAPCPGSAAPPAAAVPDPLHAPPGAPPVAVRAGFYLLNLASVSERTESFEADAYLQLAWDDPRLAFTPKAGGDARRVFVGRDAEEVLKGIWWPEAEFVNAVNPQVKNRSLAIAPDGSVTCRINLTSQFRSRFDFRRFPFDRQVLEVRLQSFLFDHGAVRFVPDPSMHGFAGGDTCDDLRVTGVQTVCRAVSPPGLGSTYSEFVVLVCVSRNSAFYVWRIFFPTVLVMAMSFAVYFVQIPELYHRVALCLSCLLACIATQFAISFNIPKISYLTVVDRVYLLTYASLALGAAVSVLEHALHGRRHPGLNRLNRMARWAVPLLYAAILLRILLPHAW